MTFKFDSKIELGSYIQQFDQLTVKNEPMLFSCDLQYANTYGGEITKKFLMALDKKFVKSSDLIIDSRVHMLMPGWFPCIPGYHHDDVPRSLSNGQPNYYNPEYKSNHAMLLVNGDICPTEFALGEADFDDIEEGEKYYKVWHRDVIEYLGYGHLKKVNAESNRIIYFDWNTWHTGTKAVANGWRFFIRASINTARKPTNEIRRQVQVYLENPMEGW